MPELAQAGERNLLIAPVGFIADHVEVLYDLDIGVQKIARGQGVHVERTPMLNDGPALIRRAGRDCPQPARRLILRYVPCGWGARGHKPVAISPRTPSSPQAAGSL